MTEPNHGAPDAIPDDEDARPPRGGDAPDNTVEINPDAEPAPNTTHPH